MSWTAGVTKNTGDLITSAIWNNYMGAGGSIDYLKGMIVWLDTPVQVVAQTNKTSDIAYTDVDLTADTSANAAIAMLQLHVHIDSIASGSVYLRVRKNGTTPTYPPYIFWGDYYLTEGDYIENIVGSVLCGLDTGQIFEYNLDVAGTIKVDAYINLLGYING